jgi:5-methylthioribose kinase
MKFTLTLDGDKTALQAYLREHNWLTENETIATIEKPGEGNMNVVVRVITPKKSIIVKQARGFVQKYPDIPAPIERIKVESDFYELVSGIDNLKDYMPTMIGYDSENYVMVMEDLGTGSDYSSLYKKDVETTGETIDSAIDYLSKLHNHTFSEETITNFSDNLALRKLNYEHLFVYPLIEENGFNLDDIQTGLQAVAMEYKTDKILNERMKTLGEVYLSSGNVLLHGDYYPGSWLSVNGVLKVIDPEFCFFGKPEYDLGVMIAHLKMAQATENQLSSIWKKYEQPANFSKDLTQKFIGMEIIRRIIGLAQLPLDLTLEEKKNLLEEAKELLVNGKWLFVYR